MLELYNTLSHKKEVFKPIHGKTVYIYSCGPTVYDSVHIGNLRTYIFQDILRRVFKYEGYRVKQVINITDVEDKIINRYKKEKKRFLSEITDQYTKAFLDDIAKLNIERADKYPKVTENIKEIVKLIDKLFKKGLAYKGRDGSVYFDISKFRNYGKLARIERADLKSSERVLADSYNKEEIGDFVLWKAKKPGEPSWPSPWGDGRPGWHIECSALGMRYLGKSFDIHTGGIDLIFPHHENEIAQSEGATGKKFVNYWVHGEHLLVGGERMGKSLKNFYTLKDLEKRGFNPLVYRYFVLGANYRSKLNFTWGALQAAENALDSLYREIAFLKYTNGIKKKINSSVSGKTKIYKNKFIQAINDDLNTPQALSVLWDVIRDNTLSPEEKRNILFDFDKVFGLKLKDVDKLVKIPPKVSKLVEKRETLRNNKQFIKADGLRKQVDRLGYIIDDTKKGSFVWPKKI
jgi:cysteinyl-tRNA synthetase